MEQQAMKTGNHISDSTTSNQNVKDKSVKNFDTLQDENHSLNTSHPWTILKQHHEKFQDVGIKADGICLLAYLKNKQDYFVTHKAEQVERQDGYFYLLQSQIELDTGLTPFRQNTILQKLERHHFVTTRLGKWHKKYFKVHTQHLQDFLLMEVNDYCEKYNISDSLPQWGDEKTTAGRTWIAKEELDELHRQLETKAAEVEALQQAKDAEIEALKKQLQQAQAQVTLLKEAQTQKQESCPEREEKDLKNLRSYSQKLHNYLTLNNTLHTCKEFIKNPIKEKDEEFFQSNYVCDVEDVSSELSIDATRFKQSSRDDQVKALTDTLNADLRKRGQPAITMGEVQKYILFRHDINPETLFEAIVRLSSFRTGFIKVSNHAFLAANTGERVFRDGECVLQERLEDPPEFYSDNIAETSPQITQLSKAEGEKRFNELVEQQRDSRSTEEARYET
jgi:hypothetical protein